MRVGGYRAVLTNNPMDMYSHTVDTNQLKQNEDALAETE